MGFTQSKDFYRSCVLFSPREAKKAHTINKNITLPQAI